MFAQQGDLFVMDVTRGDILRQCAIHPGRTSQSCPSTQTQQPKVVQEVQAHDQNTGKTKNVDIVEMIRSNGTTCQESAKCKCTGDVHCT